MKNRTSDPAFYNRLSPDEQAAVHAARQVFPFKLTPEYASLIDWTDPHDPLRRQVVPSMQEWCTHAGDSPDPLQERNCMPVPGLIHKYSGRVVWLVTDRCPVHCRFCFRRWRFGPAGPEKKKPSSMEGVFHYLRQHPSVFEVILSGGDPLEMERGELNDLLERLQALPSVRLVRLHTRVPVVAWERELSNRIIRTGNTGATRIVIHVNHPNEISPGLVENIRRMFRHGIPVLSQTVLLAGINDSDTILADLFVKLAVLGIQPYYLHYPDPASGTRHFRTPLKKARALMRSLHHRLPGYAVPFLVRDIPGRGAKTRL